jgi:predicted phosphoadenosine phosphosulfate sulfurtransferase
MDVLTAARERIAWTFDNYPRVYVSYSGGKDSTVMLHLVMEEARKRQRRVGILFVDLEGQYKLTIDHNEAMYEMYADLGDPYWVALPIHLRNAVSVYETHWVCWEPGKREAWVREPPESAIVDPDAFPFFRPGMEFEEFVPAFGEWYSRATPWDDGGPEDAQATACFVGIRSDESLNRYRTVASATKASVDGKRWTTQVTENVANIYPVYDWKTADLWTYQGKNPELPYNRLYDMMYKAGLTINQMRICQPYGDDQRRGLWLFHLIEPETWARIVARVNGANTGAMYIQESGNMTGYRRISKPPQHTWRSFASLLMQSMPPRTQEHYENKMAIFQRWWMARGYPDGIPDEAPYELEAARKAPSWRRVCKSLLRNDYWVKGLGFTQHRSEAYSKYLDLMRRRRDKWDMPAVAQRTLWDEVPA